MGDNAQCFIDKTINQFKDLENLYPSSLNSDYDNESIVEGVPEQLKLPKAGYLPLMKATIEICEDQFEPSVVPGAYRSKHITNSRERDQLNMEAIIEETRRTLPESLERQARRQKTLAEDLKRARIEFQERKDKMHNQKVKYRQQIHIENQHYNKNVSKEIDEFKRTQQKTSVSRKKEIQQLFASKCRVASEDNAPTEGEIVRQLIGNQSMLNESLREVTQTILKRKGMILPQTIQEKYRKVFDKFTLSPDELRRKIAEMKKRQCKVPKKPKQQQEDQHLIQEISGFGFSDDNLASAAQPLESIQNLPLNCSMMRIDSGCGTDDNQTLDKMDPNIQTERLFIGRDDQGDSCLKF